MNKDGIGFFGLLQIVFIVLKLIGVLGNWWVTFIPSFIWLALVIIITVWYAIVYKDFYK